MEQFRQILEDSPDAILIETPTEIVYANRAARRMFGGAGPQELLGLPPLALIPPEDHATALQQLEEAAQGAGVPLRLERGMVRLDGERMDVEAAAAACRFEGQAAIQVILRDVTERRQIVLAQSRLAAIIESSEDAIFSVAPEGTIVSWNPAAERLYGHSAEEIIGFPIARLVADDEAAALSRRFRAILSGERIERRQAVHRRRDGSRVDVSVTLSEICDGEGRAVGISAIVRDVGERMRAERQIAAQLDRIREYAATLEGQQHEMAAANARLETLATTDGLTGLTNHRAFYEALTVEMRRAARAGVPLSVILLDVDHFKRVNDRFGHQAGDAVLVGVARALREGARAEDVVARYGGEEFALVLTGADAEAAVGRAELLRRTVAATDRGGHPVTASFGVCTLGGGETDPARMLASADRALYRAKAEGRNRVAFEAVPAPERLAEASA